MTVTASDRELSQLLREQSNGDEVLRLSRRPYRFATSAPLEELEVEMSDGSELKLIFKDLSRERMLAGARAAKPAFLYEPVRELEAYRHILGPAGIGPRCLAAVSKSDPQRHWLLIEKVPGVELWQVGDLSVWEDVGTWLGAFHRRFADRVADLRAKNPYLLEHSEEWFRSWQARADLSLSGSEDRRASTLRPALRRYEEVIVPLGLLPRTFVHGELYPSNVIVVQEERPLRVCPVDWEMAAIGPGLIDLAALVGGWGKNEQRRLADAYLMGLSEADVSEPEREALDRDLARCRLHLALQWIGWSPDWRAPREHRHDWIGEALMLVEELGLV